MTLLGIIHIELLRLWCSKQIDSIHFYVTVNTKPWDVKVPRRWRPVWMRSVNAVWNGYRNARIWHVLKRVNQCISGAVVRQREYYLVRSSASFRTHFFIVTSAIILSSISLRHSLHNVLYAKSSSNKSTGIV